MTKRVKKLLKSLIITIYLLLQDVVAFLDKLNEAVIKTEQGG